jgi:hypothetical protein
VTQVAFIFGLTEQAMLKHPLSKFLRAPKEPSGGLALALGLAPAAGELVGAGRYGLQWKLAVSSPDGGLSMPSCAYAQCLPAQLAAAASAKSLPRALLICC